MSIIPQDKASIVLVSESLRPGGNTVYAGLLLRGLLGVGLSPRLAAPDAPPAGFFGKEEQASVEVFPGMQGGFFRPFVHRRLIAWAQARNPSLIHGLSAFAAPVCQKLAQALDLSYVLSIQHYQSKGGLRVDGRCKAVIACSEAIRENLVNDAHVPKELVRVVTIGIDLPAREPQAPAPEGERLPLVATFAKLTPRKDLAT
ncbi:MAG: glycosyltransferase, partial [Planctomycetota bacterium]|nr:glycosyltransferase [Planctomycetota bacterium]